MAVVEKNGRWFPIGKSGKPWKTSQPTKAKAEAALIKAEAYWASRAPASPAGASGTETPAPPAEEERGLKTLARMRGLQDEGGFD